MVLAWGHTPCSRHLHSGCCWTSTAAVFVHSPPGCAVRMGVQVRTGACTTDDGSAAMVSTGPGACIPWSLQGRRLPSRHCLYMMAAAACQELLLLCTVSTASQRTHGSSSCCRCSRWQGPSALYAYAVPETLTQSTCFCIVGQGAARSTLMNGPGHVCPRSLSLLWECLHHFT